jgi:nucleoside-diphosphate-sugar epimerase
MRVMVTGNEGYVGSILVPLLKATGHQVRGFDAHLVGDYGITRVSLVPTLCKDIRDVEPADLDGIDAVIHLAGLAADPVGDLNPLLTEQINHAATVRLAELAKRAGIRRFLYASSCSIYAGAGEQPVDEESTLRPLTPYARSKAGSEQDLRRLADRDFCPIYLRAATAYGASPLLRLDLVVNNLVARAYTKGLIDLASEGGAWEAIVHVEDICRAYVALLHVPEAAVHNQAFNVGGSGENYRIRELAEIVGQTVPGTRIEHAAGASSGRRSCKVNCDKIRRAVPFFQPRWNARSGTLQLLEVIRDVSLGADELEGPRYSRLTLIRKLLAEGRLRPNLRSSRQAPNTLYAEVI